MNLLFTPSSHYSYARIPTDDQILAKPPRAPSQSSFDNLEVKFVLIGYTPKALAEQFDAQPAEIRRFLSGRLDPERTAELGAALRDAGIPT